MGCVTDIIDTWMSVIDFKQHYAVDVFPNRYGDGKAVIRVRDD